jgi:hypothetical protein
MMTRLYRKTNLLSNIKTASRREKKKKKKPENCLDLKPHIGKNKRVIESSEYIYLKQ